MSDNNGLPKGWIEAPIGELLAPLEDGRTIHHGWSPQCHKEPANSEQQWGVLKTTAIQDGEFCPEHNKLLPSHLSPRPHLEAREGDLLLTCAGPRVRCGVPCLVRSTRPRLLISGKMYRFRVSDDKISPAYLEAFLRSRDTQQAIDRMKTGISDSGLNLTHGRFLPLPVRVPPFNEQLRIVAKIEELFSDLEVGVASLKRVQANLKRYRAAVLKTAVEGKLTEAWREEHTPQETGEQLLARILKERHRKWAANQLAAHETKGKQPPKNWQARYKEPAAPDMCDLADLPEGWQWVTFDTLLREPLRNGHSPKRSETGNGVRTLTLTAVTYGEFSLKNTKLTQAIPSQVSHLWLERDDILIERSNTPELVGIARRFRGESDFAIFPDLLIRARCNSIIEPAYIEYVLLSEYGRSYFRSRAKGTAGTMPKIDQTTIRAFPVPLPPPSEQRQIVKEVDELHLQIEVAEQAVQYGLQRASRLRQSILKDAFEGKLVAQDVADEPASKLLARIKAERQAAVAKPRPTRCPHRVPREITHRRGAIVAYTMAHSASNGRSRRASHTLGRTKLIKALYIAQTHEELDLRFEFQRYAAGPFDEAIYKVEGAGRKNKWFSTQDRENYGVTYHPSDKTDSMCQVAAEFLGMKKPAMDRLLGHINRMTMRQAELFATAYAAWNDLLIDERDATDATIIDEFYAWDESKKKFKRADIQKQLKWMRSEGYVPTGKGKRTETRSKETKLPSRQRRKKS